MRKAGLGMFVAFFLLGFSSIIIQTTLIREFLVVFEGNELCLGGIFGIWFLWIMIGAPIGSLLSKWVKNAAPLFVLFVILGALAPFAQIYAIRIVRDIFDVPMSLYVSFPDMLLFALICVAPFTWMVGVTFPLGVKVYMDLRAASLAETGPAEAPGQERPQEIYTAPEPPEGGDKVDIELPGQDISAGLDATFGVEEPSEGGPSGSQESNPSNAADAPEGEMPAEQSAPEEGSGVVPPAPLEENPSGIGWVYVFESIGFLAGGMVFTFLLVEHYMPFLNAAVVFALLSLMCFLLDLRGFSRGVRATFGVIFLALSVEHLCLAMPLDNYSIHRRWEALKLDLNFVKSVDSRYQNLTVAQSKRDANYYSLLSNGHIMTNWPDDYYLPAVANFVLYEHPNPKKVLLIGNGSHGLIRFMLKHPLDRLVHVELDPMVTDVIGPYLPKEDQEVLWGKRLDDVNPEIAKLVAPLFPALEDKDLGEKRLGQLDLDDAMRKRIESLLTEKDKNAFGDERLVRKHMDGRYYVKTCDEKFDVIFANVPDPSSAMINRYYTKDFYDEVKRILAPGGVLAGTMSSAVNYLGQDIGDYAGSLYHTLRDAFVKDGGEVIITPGDHNYFFASLQKGVVSLDPSPEGPLVKRFRERGVKCKNFTEYHFFFCVGTPERREWLLKQLMAREDVPRNTDMRPISYFYQLLIWDQKTEHPNITIWGKKRELKVGPIFRWFYEFSKDGFSVVKTSNARLTKVIHALTWIRTKLHIHDLITILLALLLLRVFYVLVLRRSIPPQARVNSLLSMSACGFGSMVFSITLLFAFQNLYGFLYHMIGFITALFMFGLAMGGLAMTVILKRLKSTNRTLLIILMALMVYAIVLPIGIKALASGVLARLPLLASQACFMVLLAIGGSLTGLMFPLAGAVFYEHSKHTSVTAGLIDGADHGGACIGAFLSGTIFVPILGLAASCYFVAVIGGICAVLQAILVLKERKTLCRSSSSKSEEESKPSNSNEPSPQ
ncbi:MAG: hypothetical protein GXP25_15450 [Planctomycetes bacterium]|nr:hypothetical protein [Planctomycetota bacterium]